MNAVISKAIDFVTARRKAGLSDETMAILLYLRSNGESRRDHIAEGCEINPTTLPRYLSGLHVSGHIAKIPGRDDQREVRFVLSQHGERLVASLIKHFSPDAG